MTQIKQILIILAVASLAGWLAYPFINPSEDYWNNIGPNWDRMLNPCKYEACA